MNHLPSRLRNKVISALQKPAIWEIGHRAHPCCSLSVVSKSERCSPVRSTSPLRHCDRIILVLRACLSTHSAHHCCKTIDTSSALDLCSLFAEARAEGYSRGVEQSQRTEQSF